MELRILKLNQLKEIKRIEDDCFTNPLSYLILIILKATTTFYTVLDEDKIMGYMSLGYDSKLKPHIYRIAVGKSMHRLGIGSKLLSVIKGKCTVATRLSNKSSIKFYEKHGFKRKGLIKKKDEKLVWLER